MKTRGKESELSILRLAEASKQGRPTGALLGCGPSGQAAVLSTGSGKPAGAREEARAADAIQALDLSDVFLCGGGDPLN